MPTRRIEDVPEQDDLLPLKLCQHPDHLPAMHRVYEPGRYVHVCSGCGHELKFFVSRQFAGMKTNALAYSAEKGYELRVE